MREVWLFPEGELPKSDKARVGRLASGQRGRITRAQLIALGVQDRTVTNWASSGYLYQELPHVFAVGSPARSEESDLFAAVLYAGPYASLRAMTAALWRGLVKWRTQTAIEVSTPRRCRSLPAGHPSNHLHRAIEVRDRRPPQRWDYHGIPTVPTPNVVLGLAATKDVELVRFALAQLDFMRRLDVPRLEAVAGPGVPGSQTLHEALANHQPLLAKARSQFEIRLIQVCELTDIPLPDLNGEIQGITPDATWHDPMVIVQCDGEGNHGTWAQRKRDARQDQILRGLGFLVIRYTYEQLNDPWAIHADLMPILEERAGRGAKRLSA